MKKIIIYSTPTCTYCNQAKDYFKENDISYEEHDVSVEVERRNEMIEKSGQMGVPVIFVGEEMIIGFNREKVGGLLEGK